MRWADVGAKTRPVVLLTRDAIIGRLRSFLVAPCTTTIRNLPSEVTLGTDDGLPRPCIVNLDNVTLVEAEAVGQLISTLGEDVMTEICSALAVAVGCEAGRR